jgi:hypothetical protein
MDRPPGSITSWSFCRNSRHRCHRTAPHHTRSSHPCNRQYSCRDLQWSRSIRSGGQGDRAEPPPPPLPQEQAAGRCSAGKRPGSTRLCGRSRSKRRRRRGHRRRSSTPTGTRPCRKARCRPSSSCRRRPSLGRSQGLRHGDLDVISKGRWCKMRQGVDTNGRGHCGRQDEEEQAEGLSCEHHHCCALVCRRSLSGGDQNSKVRDSIWKDVFQSAKWA